MTDYSSKNRILIIRLSSLGDILLTSPLVRSLKKNYPDLKIDFLLREQYEDVYRYNPYINKLFSVKNNENIPDELLSSGYDLLIDLQNNFRSARLRRKIRKKESRIFNKRTLDKFLLVKFKINRLRNAARIPVRYSETLDNFELDDEGPDLFTGDLKSSINGSEKDYIGFAPGSRHFTKIWPSEYYINLANKLRNEGYTAVFFGGKDDKSICDEISVKVPGSLNLCNENDLLLTASNIRECKAVVSNDSGLMHVACAVKVPVLAIFGSTVKEFGFTPYKNKNVILENKALSCRPCSHIGRDNCPKKHFKCMIDISPDSVFINLMELIRS